MSVDPVAFSLIWAANPARRFLIRLRPLTSLASAPVRLVGDNGVERWVVTGLNALQASILAALQVNTATWHSRLSA